MFIGNQTYVYNETTTTTNYKQNGFSDGNRSYPPPRDIYPSKKEIQTQTSVNFDYPKPANQTIVYKEETRTTNTQPTKGYPPKDVEVLEPQQRPPYANKPVEPVNVTYKYHSHSTNENKYRGASAEESRLLLQQTRPFPKDDEVASPPKRVEDLLATLGHEVSVDCRLFL